MTDIEREAMTALVNLWKSRTVELLAAVLPLAEYVQDTFGDVTETHHNARDTEVKLPLDRIMPIFDTCAIIGNAMGDEADKNKA